MLIASVDVTYIFSLRNKYIGYANITTLQMLTQIYSTYAKISEGDLEEKYKHMRSDYNVNQPMEVLIEQIDDDVDMAAAANNLYSDEQVVTATYNLVFKTGMFADNCKLWRRHISGDKIWEHFKTYFTMSHQELRESQTTSQGAGYHSANNTIMHTSATADQTCSRRLLTPLPTLLPLLPTIAPQSPHSPIQIVRSLMS